MTLDILQSIIRAVLNAVGGTVIAKGYSDSSTWEAVTGGAVMLASVIWSAWHQRQLKTVKNDKPDPHVDDLVPPPKYPYFGKPDPKP